MDLDRFRQHCLRLPGVTEETPFGPDVLVFKVGPPSRKPSDGQAKLFALAPLDLFESVNLKCDPERAVELRAEHPGITPGYHMNKVHWNSVACDGSVPDRLILELVDHSYDLVRASLPKKVRAELEKP
jgi:predicted DNA-binding protein (MmcQ/YjbR family)